MLKPPKLAGAGQLRLFVDELGFEWACKCVDVHPSTMRRYLREATPVPQAVLQALYWLTRYGFTDAAAEVHWSHQYLVCKVRELEAALAWRAPDRWQAANDATAPAGQVVPLRG
ncbi:MAG: hypothetical protein V4609_17510 [Pseudomonadota bacterium]